MTEEKKYEETVLLAMLAGDSESAFQLLFERYKDRIYKVAILYVKLPTVAEEILQDVFMKVWINRKTLTGLSSFECWLYTVVKNVILNYNKRLAAEWKVYKNYSLKSGASENDTDFKIREAQLQALLQKALSQLSPQQQLIYSLAKEEHLSYHQIAQRLSISSLTVKTHLSRALNSFRSYLKQYGEFIVALLCATAI